MPSQDKLIKTGIKYTDKLFDEISKRLEKGVKASDSLETFLDKYHKAFPKKGNPLISLGYDKTMIDLILSETNNHRFSRPAQKELVRVTVEEKVGELIVDVGEDIKDSVRDIVRDGYNRNLSQDEIASNISARVSAIKGKRARAIARTEIARTATVSDYVINRERGANGWYVECRNTACPVCKDRWHKSWTPENDDSFTPSDTSAGGKGWIGDRIFSMDDTGSLPPVHPNCYDKETKVYTNNGWKYFKDLTDDDLVLSINPQTNETEFIKPVQIFKHENTDGFLYHIHNKWFDVCVTSDHDCFIHQRRDGGNRGRYFEPQFRKPSELNSETRFVRCIDTDRENPNVININGLEFEPSDFAFFMAWYISEGSVLHNPETAKAHGYPVKITQEIASNRDVIEPRLKAICDKLGYRLAIGKSYYEIYSKPLYDYLVELGYSNEKYIPKEVFTLDKECLNIFLDNYVLGDGHERTCNNDLVQNSSERILFTSSKQLRDDLSYLILLCGFYPSINIHTRKGTVSNHKNGEYVQKDDVYRIAINKSKYTTFSSCTVDKIPYDDFVYCVELPRWHTLWVMRNGKTSWNGNCRCVVYYTSEEPNVSTEPVQQTTSTTVEEPVAPTPTGHSTHELIRTYEDHADAHGRKETVYVYDDVEIALCSDANLTVDEVRAHLDFLPKEFLENTNRISIKDYKEGDTGGDFNVGSRNVRVLHNTNKESQLDIITHELSHSTDRFVNNNRKDNSEPMVISKHANVETWEKIFKEDNKLYTYTKANGRKRTPKKFPTEYAGKSWLKFKKNKLTKSKMFSEDYAESCKLYFNPKTHEKFCKDFPNRAKYIQNEFGKPNFKKSIFEQITAQDNEVKVKLQQEKAKKEKAQSEEFKKWFTPEKQKQYKWAKKEYEKYSIMKKALMYDDSELLVKNGYFDKKEASDFVKNKNKHLSRVNERAYKLKRIVQGVEEQMAKLK